MYDPWAPLEKVFRQRAPRWPLHLPAHGRGRGLAKPLRDLLRQHPGRWDLPELPAFGGPLLVDGAVGQAQRQAAALLGADQLWFGVNGASGLLQAAVLALCPPGSRLLLPRNLHRCLLHACVLAGVRPVLFSPPYDEQWGLWLPPTPQRLRQVLRLALADGPLAAVVLIDPTYQGLAADLVGLSAEVHAADLPLLVDQAHGHGSALAAGADLVVLSMQKTFGGLAQSAALALAGSRVNPDEISRSLEWLQTSSPSALLLASAAAAFSQAYSTAGKRQRSQALGRAQRLRQRLLQLNFQLLDNQDPLRLVLATALEGINGLQADQWLMQHGVVAELPEPGCLTFCLGQRPSAGLCRGLPQHLLALRRALAATPLPSFLAPPLPLIASPAMDVGRAWRAASRPLPLEEAVGCIAAKPLCPYPPGIPLLIPGEHLDRPRLDWLLAQRNLWGNQIADTVTAVASSSAV